MVLPYHYKSFSLRLFVSVALLNILGILVINSGAIMGIVDARTTTKEEIGLLMTKTGERKEEEA